MERHGRRTGEGELLDGHFSKKRVRVTDFFHPFFRPTVAAKFDDCELLGPGVIVPVMSDGTAGNP